MGADPCWGTKGEETRGFCCWWKGESGVSPLTLVKSPGWDMVRAWLDEATRGDETMADCGPLPYTPYIDPAPPSCFGISIMGPETPPADEGSRPELTRMA